MELWKSTRYPYSRAAVGRSPNPAQRPMPLCNPRHHTSKKFSYPEKGSLPYSSWPSTLTAPRHCLPPSLPAVPFFCSTYQLQATPPGLVPSALFSQFPSLHWAMCLRPLSPFSLFPSVFSGDPQVPQLRPTPVPLQNVPSRAEPPWPICTCLCRHAL